MLRIALCDDNTKFVAGLRQSVAAWFDKYDGADIGKVLIEEFASSEQLAACPKKETFDILLLDIEMPKLTGWL